METNEEDRCYHCRGGVRRPSQFPDGGPTATMVAAIDDLDVDAVRALLSSGVGPNARDAYGGWPVLLLAIDAEVDSAAQSGEPLTVEVTRVLLEAGASPGAQAGDQTALQMAEARGHTLAAALLRDLMDKEP